MLCARRVPAVLQTLVSRWSVTGHLPPQRGVVYSAADSLALPVGYPTFTHYLQDVCRPYRDKTALIDVHTGRSLTYEELFQQCNAFAHGLQERGFGKGDVYLLSSPNTLESVIALLGVMATGGTLSSINPANTSGELLRAVQMVNPSFFQTTDSLAPSAEGIKRAYNGIKEVVISGAASSGHTPFANIMSNNNDLPRLSLLDPTPEERTSLLLFSSGTTGLPKAVQLSSMNIMAAVQSLCDDRYCAWREHDVVYNLFPYFHVGGIIVGLTGMLFQGCTLPFMTNFEFEAYLKYIEKYKATMVLVPPTIARLLVSHPLIKKYDLSSVQVVLIGGAPVGQSLTQQLLEKLKGVKVLQAYGMTEITAICHTTMGLESSETPLGTVGRLIPNYECMICDVETEAPLAVGETGEVWLRGPSTMQGYLDNPEATKATLRDGGWCQTGDIGYCDKDGFLFIVDRKKELIKYRAFQVAPAELENLLLSHDAVADVGVIGVPSVNAEDELPRAYVVLAQGKSVSAEELEQYVAENAAYYKHLRGGVRFVDEIPKLASGKILRRVLRDRAKEETNK